MQKKEREERERRASVTAMKERGGFAGLLQLMVGLGKLPFIFFPPNFFFNNSAFIYFQLFMAKIRNLMLKIVCRIVGLVSS